MFRSPIRSSAFVGKEIRAVLRQPRLIVTLAFGPFLILLLFGVGFRNTARALRTLYVAPQNDTVKQQIEAFGTSLGPQLVFMGTTANEAEAKARLARGQVDLVVILPSDALASIRQSHQAVFTLYHNEIDPAQAAYLTYFGQLYIAEVNRRILAQMARQAQARTATLHDQLVAAQTDTAAVQAALKRGDSAGARQQQQNLNQNLSTLELGLGASLGLLQGLEQNVGSPAGSQNSQAILQQIASVRRASGTLNNIPDNQTSYASQSQAAADVATGLAQLDAQLTQLRAIAPEVLVSPFRSEARSVAGLSLTVADFYGPAVLALLLQHLAVTFGALSIVDERLTGTLELFRVSPISPGEVLVGKYVSYMLFGGALATVLTLLLHFGLGVPMLGNWLNYVAVIALLLFASLGIGFVVSLLSETDSQAVQLAMLVLLASVFFSGFFAALYLFWPPVLLISWLLPVTYGVQLLQGIMLRAAVPNITYMAALLVIGLILFVVAWDQLRRLMARR